MSSDAGFLKYIDIPFSFAIITLALPFNFEDINSLFPILFLTSILATALELLDPFGYFLRVISVNYFFKIKHTEQFSVPSRQINIVPIFIRALKSEVLSKSKNRLIGIFYFIIILLLSPIKLYEFNNLSGFQQYFYPVIILIAPLMLLILWLDWIKYPIKAYLVAIYLLKIEGHISRGNSFNNFESAIINNHWVIARYYALESFKNNDFTPEPPELGFIY